MIVAAGSLGYMREYSGRAMSGELVYTMLAVMMMPLFYSLDRSSGVPGS
jgi:hypothetical protein